MKFIEILKKMRDSLEDLANELSEELDFNIEGTKAGLHEIENKIDAILEESGGIDDNVFPEQVEDLYEAIKELAEGSDIELDNQQGSPVVFQALYNDASAMRDELDDGHILKPSPYAQS
jgi:hypothetical protein